MENEKACWKCNCFMSDKKDFETGYGICIDESDVFEAFCDDIYENSDFSGCMNLYDERRFSGERNVCENYMEAELIEIDDDMNSDEILATVLLHEEKNRNIDDLKQMLDSKDCEEKRKAIKEIINLIFIGNKMAYEALLNDFILSEPAITIEDVHRRIEIIEALQIRAEEKELVEPFINELLKTPSNNTTRQIYTKIFKFFERCSSELAREPLMNYLDKSKCSYRIKSRVIDIVEGYNRFKY